jgi:hypothetical protein
MRTTYDTSTFFNLVRMKIPPFMTFGMHLVFIDFDYVEAWVFIEHAHVVI